MTRAEAAKVLEALTSAYRSTSENFTEETARTWMDHLKDVDYDASLTAAETWIDEHPKFPTIADFRLGAMRAKRLRQSDSGRSAPVCAKCKGELLIQVQVRSGAEAYVQCPACAPTRHKDGCSCHSCHYSKPSSVETEGLIRA